MMKRLMCLLLMLALLVPGMSLAEGDFDLSGAIDMEANEPAEADEGGEEIYIDDEDSAQLASMMEILDAEIDHSVDPGKLDLNKNLPDHVINILLVGIDSRADDVEDGSQHGDVQIIVSINTQDGSIKLTSVLRDLYVTIPGYKSKNRINVAYDRGGGELAMRTVNNLLELNIEHYVAINFYGLASIIDSLGGVDIELTKQEAGAINTYINKNLKKGGYDNQDKDYKRVPLEKKNGVQHLDGIQAVMYARLRSIDNDFARSNRQRHLMEVLLAKVLDGGMDLDKLFNLIAACLPYAKTNMSMQDMVTLALGVLNSGIMERVQTSGTEGLLEQARVPMDETWKYYTTDGGASVVAFRTDKRRRENVEAVHEFIYGEYIPAD